MKGSVLKTPKIKFCAKPLRFQTVTQILLPKAVGRGGILLKLSVFIILFSYLAIADDLKLTSVVEDAVLDVKGNLYVLKYVIDADKNKFLVSRYRTDGSLDPAFGNEGHLLIKLPVVRGSELVNAKLAVCPVTGDIILGAGRTRPSENQPLNLLSSEANIRELFSRPGMFGDNRTVLMRFSDRGRLRAGFGSSGYKEFKMGTDNHDRFYSLSVAPDGRLIMSWRLNERSKFIATDVNGKLLKLREVSIPGHDTFATNLSVNGTTNRIAGAGIALEVESGDPEVARPVFFKGKTVQLIDKVYEESENRRALSSAVLVGSERRPDMMVVVPGLQNDSIETLDLRSYEGDVKYVRPVAGFLVLDVARPTERGSVLLLSVKPDKLALIATEIDPKDGRTVRVREVGTLVAANHDVLNPTCVDLLTNFK